MRACLPPAFLFTTFTTLAQDQAPNSLLLFRAAMDQEAIKEFPPRAPEQYTLVWKEQLAGTTTTYTRGDGSTLAELLTPEGTLRPDACDHCWPNGITNYGNRYAVVWISPETGFARYTAWYFERR